MANTLASWAPNLSGEIGTATATSNAATLNAQLGVITSESLTTAQDATYTCTVTNSLVGTGSVVLVSIANGSNNQGTTVVTKVTPGAGSFVVIVANKHASAQAFNGTIKISFLVL
jgi:hypothetical protein